MMFDYCISNPPYQLEVREKGNSGVGDTANIFPMFQIKAYEIAKITTLIYPGGRWIRGTGRGCKTFGQWLLTNPHLQSVTFIPGKNVQDVFPQVSIGDGVSIVYMNRKYKSSSFVFNGAKMKLGDDVYIPLLEEDLRFVVEKTKDWPKIDDSWNAKEHRIEFNGVPADQQTAYDVKAHPEKPTELRNPVKALINNTGGTKGRVNEYWIEDSVQTNHDKIPLYKVTTSSAIQGSEKPSSWRFYVVKSDVIPGYQRITLRFVATEEEANNMLQYLNTPLCRVLLCAGSGSRNRIGTNITKFIPDLEDYTDSNSIFTPDNQLPKNHRYHGCSLEQRLQLLFDFNEYETMVIRNACSIN